MHSAPYDVADVATTSCAPGVDRYGQLEHHADLGEGLAEVTYFSRPTDHIDLDVVQAACERGRSSAQQALDQLAHDDVEGRGAAAQRVLDYLDDDTVEPPNVRSFVRGYRQVMESAVSDAGVVDRPDTPRITAVDVFGGCTLEVRDAGKFASLWLTDADGLTLGCLLDDKQRLDLVTTLLGGVA